MSSATIRLQSTWRLTKRANGCEMHTPFFGKKLSWKGALSGAFGEVASILEVGCPFEDFDTIAMQRSGLNIEQVRMFVDELKKRNAVVVTQATDWNMIGDDKHDRQVRFFNSFESSERDGMTLNDSLQNRSVVIVGMGGFGSWIALLCARLGVKNIIGIDFDTVEMSNLNRQILFDESSVGFSKVNAAKENLARQCPEVNFTAVNARIDHEEDLRPSLKGADFVFNPFGLLPFEDAKMHISSIVMKAAVLEHVPHLSVGANFIGPLWTPTRGPCLHCALLSPSLSHVLINTEKNAAPVLKRQFTPVISTACSMAVWEMAMFLSNSSIPRTLNGVLTVDWLSASFGSMIPVPRSLGCALCEKGIYK